MHTCVVQLRLHIFYLLLKLFIFGSGGSALIIFALHTYISQLSLYIIEFCLQVFIVNFFCYKTFFAIHKALCQRFDLFLHLLASVLYIMISLEAFL